MNDRLFVIDFENDIDYLYLEEKEFEFYVLNMYY